MKKVEFQQTYSENYIKDFVYNYLLKKDEELVKYQKKLKVKPWIIIGMIVLEAIIIIVSQKIEQSDYIFMSIIALVIGLNMFSIKMYRKRIYKQYANCYEVLPCDINFVINDKGVTRSYKGQKIIREWKDIKNYEYYQKQLILLGDSDDFAIFFDVDKLNTEDKTILDEFLNNKVR